MALIDHHHLAYGEPGYRGLLATGQPSPRPTTRATPDPPTPTPSPPTSSPGPPTPTPGLPSPDLPTPTPGPPTSSPGPPTPDPPTPTPGPPTLDPPSPGPPTSSPGLPSLDSLTPSPSPSPGPEFTCSTLTNGYINDHRWDTCHFNTRYTDGNTVYLFSSSVNPVCCFMSNYVSLSQYRCID
ncbi:hypothetical protein Pcinc_038048 [Petrolisthes cinctipes]|uniref:Uncharacterized protein n=1 Tax=Petrolisthes cinctipes TaxID=88211 RepID=A0AAE1BRU6_PETCI|nr:hypothetical protein Pcinc_038048 [Petrolisthes cinctipes]